MIVGMISDLHFQMHKRSNKFLPHVVRSIELFEEECKKRSVDRIVIPGDLFHYKEIVSVEAQNAAIVCLRKLMRKYPTDVLPGNHDILTRKDASINGCQIFDSDCSLYNEPGTDETDSVVFHYMPYFPDDIYTEKLNQLKLSKTKKNILFTHVGLRGFDLDNGWEDVFSDMGVDNFRSFHRVFSGHYHSHQTRGNVIYVSSPFESHFGDSGLHGFCFYNTETDEIEFVENHLSPRFVEIELSASNLGLLNTVENAFIKLKINKHIDSALLLRYKTKLLKKNFDVIYDFNISATNQKIAVAKDWSDYIHEHPDDLLKSYIETVSVENKKELLDYILV